MNISTQAVQIGLEWDNRTGAVTVPIYQTATFRHPGLGQSTGYDYSRSGNPTRQALEVSEGILRLAPTWVPRVYLQPGRRLKASSANRSVVLMRSCG